MRKTRIVLLIAAFSFSALALFAQQILPDPGQNGGGGTSVPLDGGILLALLAAGGVGASLYSKSKKKEK